MFLLHSITFCHFRTPDIIWKSSPLMREGEKDIKEKVLSQSEHMIKLWLRHSLYCKKAGGLRSSLKAWRMPHHLHGLIFSLLRSSVPHHFNWFSQNDIETQRDWKEPLEVIWPRRSFHLERIIRLSSSRGKNLLEREVILRSVDVSQF